jgi:PucR C-terminal helix-turn-helix domain
VRIIPCMRGLMIKLLNVDAEGERALRVVDYFDQLLANHPDLEGVVRATAIIADCTAGLRIPGESTILRFTRDGDALMPDPATQPTASLPLFIDEFSQIEGLVWLEREVGQGNLDDFILERMALTSASVLRRHQESRTIYQAAGFADPALADLLVNERANEADRSRAARLMGLDPWQSIQLIAVGLQQQSPRLLNELNAALRAGLRRSVHMAQMTSELVLAVVVTKEPICGAEIDIADRACSGPLVSIGDAPLSWARARQGLRFASLGPSWPRFIDSAHLGTLPLLLELDPRRVRSQPDVHAMQKLYDSSAGAESIHILDLFLHTDSLRSAAREANFHHSSVQTRLQRIERLIDIDLRSGVGRQRAAHALLLWQLFGS